MSILLVSVPLAMPTPMVLPGEEGVLLTIMATRTMDMATVTDMVMVIHIAIMDTATTMVILMGQVEEE